MAIFLSLTFIPLQVNARTPDEPTVLVDPKPAETVVPEKVKDLELRLNEINSMDKSKLTSKEKKEMRKEVKTINNNLREINGGVYLSVGAIILICILLIVLL